MLQTKVAPSGYNGPKAGYEKEQDKVGPLDGFTYNRRRSRPRASDMLPVPVLCLRCDNGDHTSLSA
jgi:hypothetical protein